MSEWISIIILGVIEGITEFLPISSTGHLLLVQNLFGEWIHPQSDLFNITIQSAAVLAVLPLFPDRLKAICFKWRQRKTRDFILKMGLAFGITGAGGLILEMGGFALPDDPDPIAAALLIGGIFFLGVERWMIGKVLNEEITWRIAICVGLGQLIAAVFPGASRSGTTILIALTLGLSRPAATEFSFLVGIPTMLAASAYKITSTLTSPVSENEDWGMLLLGFSVSAIVSFIVVKWLLDYTKSHNFKIFGWYRIGLGMIIFVFAK